MYEATDIAERIKFLAKQKKIQIKTMLEDCGLSKNMLSSMLSGGSIPKSENLAKIADYLDCSVDYLLGRTEEKEKPTAPEGDELDELLKDPETREFYELIKDFSDDELEDLLNYGQYLIAKRDSKEKP